MQQMTSSVQLVMALGGGWSTNDLPTRSANKQGQFAGADGEVLFDLNDVQPVLAPLA
jgi:hypothetical protein